MLTTREREYSQGDLPRLCVLVVPGRISSRKRAALSHVSLPLLQLERLCLTLGGKSVLDDIGFTVEPGRFIGLLGPNGAGKSSLLRCIYRYYSPTSGNIRFGAKSLEDYQADEYARRVAVVLQESPERFGLTVKDVVSLGLLPHQPLLSATAPEERARVSEALNRVGLADKGMQGFDTLSGGEKQRAMLARALVQQPELLILDEPTSHLDIQYQIRLMRLVRSLGVTVLASFHDLNLAAALCDSLLVLKNGRLVAHGAPGEVLTAPLLHRVFGVEADVVTDERGVPYIRYGYGDCDV